MKSKRGVPSPAQRQVFADFRAMGADVYVARSAAAAIEALRRSHVPFRQPWQPPQPLAEWEGPFLMTDPHQRLPQHPEVAAQRRAEQRRWRLRRKQKAAEHAAAALDMAAIELSAPAGWPDG